MRSREDASVSNDDDDDLDGDASGVGFSRTRVQALGRAVAGSSDDVSGVTKPSGRKKAVSLAELKRLSSTALPMVKEATSSRVHASTTLTVLSAEHDRTIGLVGGKLTSWTFLV